jgi:hypothetical protein
MKTITTKVYQFSELSDAAKENARDWWHQCAIHLEWWNSTYDDAKRIGLKITGFELDCNRQAAGKFISGAEECAWKIEKEHGEQCETFKTAQAFLKERDAIVQAAPRDEVGEPVSEWELDEKLNECEAEFLKSILEDYSIMLQNESEYLVSNEAVDESITDNEYTFTESGKRFG